MVTSACRVLLRPSNHTHLSITPYEGAFDLEGEPTGGRSRPVEVHNKRRTCTPRFIIYIFLLPRLNMCLRNVSYRTLSYVCSGGALQRVFWRMTCCVFNIFRCEDWHNYVYCKCPFHWAGKDVMIISLLLTFSPLSNRTQSNMFRFPNNR
jgi:hypothetical protein